jgi:hypothetical protein
MAYLGLIAGGFVALGSRRVAASRIFLVAANMLLFGIMSMDYRLRSNQLYMLFWLNAVFLFWPLGRWAIPLILISFYFWSGCLKLNEDWLSGAALYHELWLIPTRFTKAACIYVVALEIVMSWGLLSGRRWVRWLVLSQLALFHLESLSQIHWFYAALMATMLAWFAMETLDEETGRPALSQLLRGHAPRSAYVLLALFAVPQLAPLLYRGDTTLNGQGRILALRMFEYRPVCEVSATLHYPARQSETIDLKLADLTPRFVCDPIVYYSRVENICRSRSETGLTDVDLFMKVKRTTDPSYRTIIDERDFCNPPRQYSVIFNNSWIH